MSLSHHKLRKKRKNTKTDKGTGSEIQKDTRKLNRQKKKIRSEKRKKLENKKNEEKKAQVVKKTEYRRNQKIQKKLKREQSTIQDLSKKLLNWLKPEQIQKIALVTGYLKKLNPKIPPLPFVLTLAFGMFGNGSTTYIMLAANMATWFEISITAQALFGRMSKIESVNFLGSILSDAMSSQLKNGFKNQYSKIFHCFTDVHLEDSTQFELHEKVIEEYKGSGGSASKAAMKLNVVYSMIHNTISHLDIVSGVTSDQTLSKNVRKLIKKGELWIRDLGYFNIFDMFAIVKKGAYYLFGVGFDSAIGKPVSGGVPVVIKSKTETVETDVPVTE